ncbi:uncharacterized protein LOC141595439 [Silene latifolia]|uniref:uncharacterized protein LOC141595439 n=1 Tax=Silene latifolia TaxID=37657 RepID=UPI003D76C8FC
MALKKTIVEGKIFEEVAAFVYVVEFQKRGLPHAHILLIMKCGSKMNCTDDFDKFFCAEIPPVTNESLRTVVLKHMMHIPCGHLDPDRQCMQHKKSLGCCKYGYPKQFATDTTNSSDRYPVYRRRQTGDSAKVRGEMLNNRWVIPYNPYLLDLFDCHLNVEVCSTIQAVKYLYKYVYKGHDKISFNIAAGNEVQEVTLKLRLIEEDNMVDLCLDEARMVQMPAALRCLFATVLIFCQPKDTANLSDKYYTSLSKDYLREYPYDAYTVKVLIVRKLEQHLEAMGKSLKAFGLNHLSEPQDTVIHQQHVFNTIMEHVAENKPGAFFVDGPGGTGKTYLYNALFAEVRLLGKIVLPTATSWIAAANIPSGRTTHSRFKIPLDLDVSLSCVVPKQGSLAALIQETSLIIWDEASMARKETVEALDKLLRDLCDPNLLFGGKLIVFGGDFRQVLPVVPHKSLHEVVNSSIVASAIWPQLTKFRLTVNVRAKDDPEFSEFVLALGNGELQLMRLCRRYFPPQRTNNLKAQISSFEQLPTEYLNGAWTSEQVIESAAAVVEGPSKSLGNVEIAEVSGESAQCAVMDLLVDDLDEPELTEAEGE